MMVVAGPGDGVDTVAGPAEVDVTGTAGAPDCPLASACVAVTDDVGESSDGADEHPTSTTTPTAATTPAHLARTFMATPRFDEFRPSTVHRPDARNR
ncbi:hypothetical protein GCM10011610_50110 [Nocardia rhizosphaerihabitans]|uniref:Uncharacterized protein n=1 Tax=Nocardia rhizosphaerihabitans TaxID=1691570 RepID=A0ABQ2KRA2_9NOCA|nr:hypothetical protein GCM10011610_50110 [Nocardia rhizosphaerihabitans]